MIQNQLVSSGALNLNPQGGATLDTSVPTPQANQQTSPSTKPIPQGLDPQAVNLARAIRQTETGGNFQAQGKSGEYGAYQFLPSTWQEEAPKYGVNVPLDQATPEQQNEVAYKRIKRLKDQGYNVGQIASMWNSGSPSWEGNVGVNKQGVAYNTPDYVNKVNRSYQSLKQQSQQSTVSPQSEEPGFFQNIASGNVLGATKQALDFAFPVIHDIADIAQGKSKKSTLQVLGDLGLSALWFVPGLGEGIGAGIKGAGLLGEVGSQIAGHVLGGALGGYGADVASKLSAGQTDAGKVLEPGIGTVTGGALGGVLGKLGTKYSESGVLKDIAKGNNAILGQTKRGATDLAEAFSKNKDIGQLLAEKKINLASLYNPDTLAFDTLGTAQKLRGNAGSLNDALSQALRKVPGTQNVGELEGLIDSKLGSFYADKVTASEAQNIAKKEFENITTQYGNNLDASTMNSLKQRFWNLSHFDSTTSNLTRRTYRAMGNEFKTIVEDMGKKAGLSDIGEFNNYLGSHLDAADMLTKLNGTKVKGGRLGDLLQKHTLGLIGAGAGGVLGGGIPGAIIGGVAMEKASGKVSDILRSIGASPVKTRILNSIVEKDPEVVQKIIGYANKNPKELKPITDQLKKMGINLFQKVKSGASKVAVPEPTKMGLLPRLLETTALRGVTPQTQVSQQ